MNRKFKRTATIL